jgi:hypothetical protein
VVEGVIVVLPKPNYWTLEDIVSISLPSCAMGTLPVGGVATGKSILCLFLRAGFGVSLERSRTRPRGLSLVKALNSALEAP